MSPRDLNAVSTDVVMHTKPKTSSSTRILRDDYICTKYDHDVIKPFRKNKSNMDEVLVYFEKYAATITRGEIDCLFQKTGKKAYLNDSVVNAYIGLMKDQVHLMNRTDGSAVLEDSFVAEVLKSDATRTAENDDFYTLANSSTKRGMEKMVARYLTNDMIFLPINIKETHWYLAVVNAKKGIIQILDSLAAGSGREDLDQALKGLQLRIDVITKYVKIEGQKWKDLKVAKWSRIEIKPGQAEQTDDCSCGLFMLNNMEYWTGESLTDMFTQADMTQFRTKLAAILLACEQNNVQECPSVKKKLDVEIERPDDIVCLGTPSELLTTPKSIIGNAELHAGEKTDEESVNKRTRSCLGLDDNGCDHRSDVGMVVKNLDELLDKSDMEMENQQKTHEDKDKIGQEESPSKRQRTMIQSDVNGGIENLDHLQNVSDFGSGCFLTQHEIDHWWDEEDNAGEQIKQVKPNRDDYIHMLCSKLSMTKLPVHLEALWFLMSLEHQIKFTAKELQTILNEKTPLSTELFQLGIKMIAHKRFSNMDSAGINHYMDLSFNNMCPFWYPTNKRVPPAETSLMATFNTKNTMAVFMPLHLGGQYSLMIFQLESTKMFLFDPNPFPKWSQKIQFKRWNQKLDAIFPIYKHAMTKLSGKYVKDYWFWETPVMDDGWEERDRPASGYHVLSVIDGWNGQDELVAAKDVPTLRREFLINLLASELNEAKEVLPSDVNSWLSNITPKED
ncbi:hypothetical protein ACP70R_012935 [Stipagrostis hirtigluma subsp. patula]